jgi:putative ABC transport system substrate-binding protein
MRRREFIALAGGAAMRPIALQAQQKKPRRLGVLYQGSIKTHPTPNFRAFLQALSEAGWVEGDNITIEWRFSEGDAETLPRLMNELLALQPEVIVASPTRPALVAKQATATIPIVFTQIADPIGAGIVTNLARPEGNITGMSTQATDASAKRLALLKEMLPRASRVAVLWNRPSRGAELVLREYVAASKALNLEIKDVGISGPSELPGAFEEAIRSEAAALAVIDDPAIFGYKDQIARLMAANKIPCFSQYSEFAVAGGLMSYGPKLPELYRHAARYVDRILRGAKPSELPVEQPTIFELVINLRTAEALGIDIPATLLARADEVIE